MVSAIFWDMDGTLVDSEPLWGIATLELSEKLGRRLTPEKRAMTIGGSFANTLRVCAEHAGVTVSAEEATTLHDEMFSRVAELFGDQLAPRPGIRELLDQLCRMEVPMLVTTNTERVLADPCIDAIGREFFVDSVAGDEVPSPKPAPDMYLEAASRVGADPHECLVFEDSVAGMTAAVASGCRVVGLPEDDTDIVTGATLMTSLCGSRCFSAVNATDVVRWYDHIAKQVAQACHNATCEGF